MLGRVERSRSSLVMFVYESIRSSLQAGEYRPGDRLREEEIAKRLQVSRTPVREALGRLEARRILETSGSRGLVVRRLDAREVLELYAMREIIEGAAARLAASHATATEIEAMLDLNDAFTAASDDVAEMARINHALHEAIRRAARNRYLDFTLGETLDSIALLGSSTFIIPSRPQDAAEEHRAIIRAIGERDLDAAEESARSHIRGGLRARLRLQDDRI